MTGHPTAETLADYASGGASPGAALLVAAHATFCPACRREIATLEAAGAALMAEAPEAPGPSLEATLGRLDEPISAPGLMASGASGASGARAGTGAEAGRRWTGGLPRCVAEAAGGAVSELRWRFVAPGVSIAPLALGGADETVTLLRVWPGVAAPDHTHTGDEMMLVLGGELLDRGVTYGVGDVMTAEAAVEHEPRAGRIDECVCLVVQRGRIRFTGGLFGRALNLLAS